MAISSLPGDFGIGDFGENAYKFVDYLKKAGIKIWQILPLNPTGYGNSPYQSICGHAIDSIYIDLYELEKDGLIDNPKPFNKSKKLVDYPAVRAHKEKYLILEQNHPFFEFHLIIDNIFYHLLLMLLYVQ